MIIAVADVFNMRDYFWLSPRRWC